MDPGGQWWLSPSGSGAEDQTWPIWQTQNWPVWQSNWTWEEQTAYHPVAQTMQTAMDNVDWNDWNWDDVFALSEVTGDEDFDNTALSSSVLGSSDLPHGQPYNPKIPPKWDGKGSWFAYEELVLDWEDITVLDKKPAWSCLAQQTYGRSLSL